MKILMASLIIYSLCVALPCFGFHAEDHGSELSKSNFTVSADSNGSSSSDLEENKLQVIDRELQETIVDSFLSNNYPKLVECLDFMRQLAPSRDAFKEILSNLLGTYIALHCNEQHAKEILSEIAVPRAQFIINCFDEKIANTLISYMVQN